MCVDAIAMPYAPMPKNIVCAKLTIPVSISKLEDSPADLLPELDDLVARCSMRVGMRSRTRLRGRATTET